MKNTFKITISLFWALLIVSLVFTLPESVGAQDNCFPPPAEMISWWPGDGNTDDIANANHGMLEGGTTFSAGQVGQAFLLDGIDDSVDLGNASNLHISHGYFTVNAWVFFNALSHPPGENLGASQGDMSMYNSGELNGSVENIIHLTS